MKIISKVKDYYDYLRGIYGEDEKLTLDRTKFTQNILPHSSSNGVLEFFVCDKYYQALLKDGKIYWGEEIEQFSKEPKYWFSGGKQGEKGNYYHVLCQRSKYNSETLLISKLPQPTLWNEKLNCPILISNLKYRKEVIKDDLYVFPILKEYDFHKVMDPTAIWLALSTWLAKPKEILDTQTDKEKVVSAGFDIKTSFRNM